MRRTVFFALPGTTGVLAPTLVALSVLAGCGGSESLKKQVASLETQLTAVRADQDRLEERLAALEIASPVPSRAAKATAAAQPVEHPRLKVIHLSPDQADTPPETTEDPPTAVPDAASPRPVIRGTGERIMKTGDGESGPTTLGDEPPPRSAQLGKNSRRN